MLSPSVEEVRQLIAQASVGDEQALDDLRSFVVQTAAYSGPNCLGKMATAILDGVESGDLKPAGNFNIFDHPIGPTHGESNN